MITAFVAVLLFCRETGRASTFFPSDQIVEIPFEYRNHFILLHLTFQKTLPLTFIFDTGSETSLLIDLEIAQLLNLPYEREIQVVGADMNMELRAFLVRNIHLRIGNLSLPHQSLLVLEEDVFHFKEYTGISVHGILGASAFRQYIVQINYEKRLIRLIPPGIFEVPRNSLRMPMEVQRGKPYINAGIQTGSGKRIEAKLLIDSGAGLALLLHPDVNEDLEIPEKVIPGNIGIGLGGILEGMIGIIPALYFDDETSLLNIPTHFQDIEGRLDSAYLNNRAGILGNKTLERFTITLDYFRGALYLQTNRLFKKKFPIDKSGMLVVASGPELKSFQVQFVVEGSPASQSGIRPGDVILNINGHSYRYYDLDAIHRVLSRKQGRLVRLKIDRDGEIIRTRFRLRNLI